MLIVEYRDVPGFPGYRVGSDGSMWTNRKPGPGGQVYAEWRGLSRRPRRDGYVWVTLVRDGKSVGRALHRLILEAFVSPCPLGMQACHNNGLRNDNRLENLRWDFPSANLAERRAHGTVRDQSGEKNHRAKLTESQVREIRQLRAAGFSYTQLAGLFGIHRITVRHIVIGKRWGHLPDGLMPARLSATEHRKV